jgi:hypothetical protein
MRIKEWYKDYCQDFSPEGIRFDDKEVEPTLQLFFYNVYRKFRGWPPVYKARMLVQKIFRKNHIADCDLWEADTTMAKRILPVLQAFKKMKRNGYPGIYSEYEGGYEIWERDLDHIIHAVEFVAYGYTKKIHQWYIDNFGMDPYSTDPINKYKFYTYETEKGIHGMTFNEPPDENKGYKNIEEHTFHGNNELIQYIDEYVKLGLEKLGTSFQSIWD